MNFETPFVSIPRFPSRMTMEEFYPCAYRCMLLSRRIDEQMSELFRKGIVKGTVTQGSGNEAAAVGAGFTFRPGKDVLSILHRDLATHLCMGLPPVDVFCQYMANAASITHGREGNVHHGNAAQRRFPMVSHLGNMLSTVVGGVWAARHLGEEVFGLAVIGDGGSSAGDFHESLNIASVRSIPVLFLVQNNRYSFSTPAALQYHCKNLSDRAAAYGIPGRTIDGTDAWGVYSAVCDAMEQMRESSLPYILECSTLRIGGHAAYDKGEYVSGEIRAEWAARDPLPAARAALSAVCGLSEERIAAIEDSVDTEISRAVGEALGVSRPDPLSPPWHVFAAPEITKVDSYKSTDARNYNAVTQALDFVMQRQPESVIVGLDVGPYGSAFKTCKGLFEKYGAERVLDMPLGESGYTGFSLGASQVGCRPIVEYQFADFSTEATTQIGMNCATWYFRSGRSAPILFRLPCAGGVTLGAFHSGEFEGLWSRFPGLKLLYPTTPQETFEAIVAGFYDPNPCIVFENKYLYTRRKGDIDFDGNLESIWRPRRYCEGTDITVVALGAMAEIAALAAKECGCSIDLWNPFVLCPLQFDPICESVEKTGRFCVVQESGSTAGMADRFVSLVCRRRFGSLRRPPAIVSAPDTPVPFAPELESHYRPDINSITKTFNTLLETDRECQDILS